MRTVVKWTPQQDVARMQTQMDRLMNTFFQAPVGMGKGGEVMPLDLIEKEASYAVTAVLPGVKPADIEITVERQVLTIAAAVAEGQLAEGERYHVRERRFGKVSRSVRLPEGVATDDITADYENGLLMLSIPKPVVPKATRIPVNGAVIEAEADEA